MSMYPPTRSFYDGRLELANLRGEVTQLATALKESPACTPRDEAVARLCGTFDEVAAWFRDTLDMPQEQRASLVAAIETASERLWQIEIGE